MFVLIGCGSAKRSEPCAAKDLYTGSLFRYRRRYAETFGTDGWRIISAKYGLVDPDTVIEPYDLRVQDLGKEKYEWGAIVGGQIIDVMLGRKLVAPTDAVWDVEIHAGKEYRKLLHPVLIACRAPLAHMGIGEQLHWYKESLAKENNESSAH